jgi:hypothetical protein
MDVLHPKRPDGGYLCHVFAGFRPVKVVGAAGQHNHASRRIGVKLVTVEFISQADVLEEFVQRWSGS